MKHIIPLSPLLAVLMMSVPIAADALQEPESDGLAEAAVAPVLAALIDRGQAMAAANPDILPSGLPVLDPDVLPPNSMLALNTAAGLLAQAEIRVALEMPETASQPAKTPAEILAWLDVREQVIEEAADSTLERLREQGLPRGGRVLEDAVERAFPVLALQNAGSLFTSARQYIEATPGPVNASHLLLLLTPMEAARILATDFPPEPPQGALLTNRELEELRGRVSYRPDTININVRPHELDARQAIGDGDVVLAFLETVQAEVGHWQSQAHHASLEEKQDLEPALRREYQAWHGKESSLLLAAGQGRAYRVLSSLQGEEQASANNAGVVAADALGRFAAVHLIRATDPMQPLESLPASDESSGVAPLLLLGTATALVLMLWSKPWTRRTGRSR